MSEQVTIAGVTWIEDPVTLDEAWAEAEAALPADWFGPLLEREDDGAYKASAASVGYSAP